jgi:hypothetical protein
MLLQCFIIIISGDTLYHDVKDDSVCIMCVSLASVPMNCGVCWNHVVRSR